MLALVQAYKTKYKQLLKFKEKADSKTKAKFNALMRAKRENS